MTQKLAHRIVRIYPRAWRERYEQEMLALVEQSPTTWRDVFDLARAGALGPGPSALGPRS